MGGMWSLTQRNKNPAFPGFWLYIQSQELCPCIAEQQIEIKKHPVLLCPDLDLQQLQAFAQSTSYMENDGKVFRR